MRVWLLGELVDRDENAWEMNGRKGISYTLFVRTSPRDAPVRVRCTAVQFGAAAGLVGGSGEPVAVEWPIEVRAMRRDSGDAVIKTTLDEDFDVSAGRPA